MRDRDGRTPRRVSVTRAGADVYLVVIGDLTLALSWIETMALAAEAGEAAGLRPPPLPEAEPDPGGGRRTPRGS